MCVHSCFATTVLEILPNSYESLLLNACSQKTRNLFPSLRVGAEVMSAYEVGISMHTKW